MTFTPISGTVPQYQKSNGTLASGYYLKFYAAGTTTPLSMATDSTGGTTLAKCQINSSGYPINGSSDVFIPHISKDYKIVLYKNSTDADADTTANADWVVDSNKQTQIGNTDLWNLYSGTPTQTSATTFTVTGDQTSTFVEGLRLKFTDSTTLYGVISSSSFSSVTTVTVVLNTGSLSGSLSAVYTSQSIPNQNPVGSKSVSYLPAGTGAVDTNAQAKLRESVSVKDFGAVGDGVTNDQSAIQAAIDAVEATATGGAVYLPAGEYKITSSIAMKAGVSLIGDGGLSSRITAVSVDAITFSFTTGFGDVVIDGLNIEGSSTSNNKGIYQAGTLDDADELYGITIKNCLIRGFNDSISFRTVRNIRIFNNWLQDTNSGIKLVGKCLVVNIHDNFIVYAAGSGTGTQYAIFADWFNYTGGTGFVRPESVKIRDNHIYGFDYGVNLGAAIYAFVTGNDVQCGIEGVTWGDVSSNLSIRDNYIEVAGISGSTALRGKPQSVVLDNSVTIDGNTCIGNGNAAGTSIGCLIGSSSPAGNVDNITITNNNFVGFTLYDIISYVSGHIDIIKNNCYSSAVTQSIVTSSIPANRPVYIARNDCYSTIGYDGADFNAGRLVLGRNVINQTTVNEGSLAWTSPSFDAGNFTASGSQTWTVGAGDVTTYKWVRNGKMITVVFALASTTVGGTPDAELRIAIPASLTASSTSMNPVRIVDNGTAAIGYCLASVGNAYITVRKVDLLNWTASTNNTSIEGQITFEV